VKRTSLLLIVMILMFVIPQPSKAQSDPIDSCALLKAESDLLLAQAAQSKAANEAQTFKDTAKYYSDLCTNEPIKDDLLVKVWGYDAAQPDDLKRWMAYGGTDMRGWSVVGLGDAAYFQGVFPENDNGFGAYLYSRSANNINNTVNFTYEGKIYPVYAVPFPDKVRALPMVKKARQSADFYDPVAASMLTWQGNWRTLAPILASNIAVEISLRFRLDTPASTIKTYIRQLNGAGIALIVDQKKVTLLITTNKDQTPREIATPAADLSATPESPAWHTLRLRVQSNKLQAWLDSAQLADDPLSEFRIALPELNVGFSTSGAPATISLDDIVVSTNAPIKK
jgi:hypothetical protein